MSGAYLLDHPPVRQQFYKTRNRPLTGCTVLHTAESVMDTVGPDTGAENVAEFIRTRSTPGSYHDLVDSDSIVTLVPYESGAFHDGTGSNNWALSISFACSTADWRRMTPEKRAAFLRNGARAFAAQQAWRRAHGYPTTELRYITKAQSDAGQSGFCCHGWRDPGRRTDPGVAAPNQFPFDEFLDYCRAAVAGEPAPLPTPQISEDDSMIAYSTVDTKRGYLQQGLDFWWEGDGETYDTCKQAAGGVAIQINQRQADVLGAALGRKRAALIADVAKLTSGGKVDVDALAAAVARLVPDNVAELTAEEMKDAAKAGLVEVLTAGTNA